MRRIVVPALALLLQGCQTDQAATQMPAPDARAAVLANKNTLWKDPDSIKNASITAPRRGTGLVQMWHVCVRANARNSFGAYAGESDMLIMLYDDGKPPSVFMANAVGYCDAPHEPFPEIEGGYRAAAAKPKT